MLFCNIFTRLNHLLHESSSTFFLLENTTSDELPDIVIHIFKKLLATFFQMISRRYLNFRKPRNAEYWNCKLPISLYRGPNNLFQFLINKNEVLGIGQNH